MDLVLSGGDATYGAVTGAWEKCCQLAGRGLPAPVLTPEITVLFRCMEKGTHARTHAQTCAHTRPPLPFPPSPRQLAHHRAILQRDGLQLPQHAAAAVPEGARGPRGGQLQGKGWGRGWNCVRACAHVYAYICACVFSAGAHVRMCWRTPLRPFPTCWRIVPVALPVALMMYSIEAPLPPPQQAVGFQMGVFHVELKATSRGPRLIEINARMGGGGVR